MNVLDDQRLRVTLRHEGDHVAPFPVPHAPVRLERQPAVEDDHARVELRLDEHRRALRRLHPPGALGHRGRVPRRARRGGDRGGDDLRRALQRLELLAVRACDGQRRAHGRRSVGAVETEGPCQTGQRVRSGWGALPEAMRSMAASSRGDA